MKFHFALSSCRLKRQPLRYHSERSGSFRVVKFIVEAGFYSLLLKMKKGRLGRARGQLNKGAKSFIDLYTSQDLKHKKIKHVLF